MKVKKMRGGDFRPIDDQILRWQQKMRKDGTDIGRNTAKQRERRKTQKSKFAKADVKKINFFGGDDE